MAKKKRRTENRIWDPENKEPVFGFTQFMKMIPGPAEYMFDLFAQDIRKYTIFKRLRILNKASRRAVDNYCKKHQILIRIQDISVKVGGIRIFLIPKPDAIQEVIEAPKKIIIIQEVSDFQVSVNLDNVYLYKDLTISDHSFKTGDFIYISIIGSMNSVDIWIRKKSERLLRVNSSSGKFFNCKNIREAVNIFRKNIITPNDALK